MSSKVPAATISPPWMRAADFIVDVGPGAGIHDEVRRPHGVLVMLHYHQGVAQIPQMLQGLQQPAVVPLVQTNGGLVQDIQHPHEG